MDPSIKATFVHLAPGVPAVLYQPVQPGAKSHIGLFVMHADGDYLEFSACTELSKRGYSVLCANNSSSKSFNFNDGILDDILLQTKAGVSYLKKAQGINKVVLFGHSGGATIMTAYQAIAERGLAFCQGSGYIHKCPDKLAGLPAADGVVLADANWGQAEMVLLSIDPSVVDETSGMKSNPAFDLKNPKNGYRPDGAQYSPEFIRKYQAAVSRRANQLLKTAQDRLAAIEAGKGKYADDEAFIVPGAFVGANKMFPEDPRLLSRSRKAWPLLHGDGSVSTEIIHSVRVPESPPMKLTSFKFGALKTTVRNYLSSYAIRTTADFGYDEDSIRGVEWRSTYASPPGNAEGISVPFLALGMTGHWEGLAAEIIYDKTASADKSLAFVEGADHVYRPCTKCEKTPGQFGDTVKTTYDYVDGWLSKAGRF
ncbi:alpha/beta hydrolase [Duganella sp. FT80W]|uniref:Alpha/beta hydrolase n=1 Tax=Duganella guangzhouensis TaxID=2666084 RepID=A0A6I2L2F9_9BURK|nr:alpha/beta hydrolase [Duganella guangzhouensis]